MEFPEYKLANYQMNAGPRTKYPMGASAPESMSLQELLSLANADELRQWNNFTLGYSSSQGDETLRSKIAESYPGLDADNVIVFAGALEAIYVAFHALLKAGDRVQVITPVFEPLAIVPEAIGAQVNKIKMQAGTDGWQLDVDQWINSLKPDTSLAVINFPHNPTGAMLSKLQLEAMLESCRENDCWLFSDEVFRGLEYQPADRLPPVASLYHKGISLGVMSKAFGLGGVRVGWLACQDKALLKRMLEIKHFLSICNGRADELLTTIALNHAGAIQQKNRQIIQQNLGLLNQNMAGISGKIQWHQPQAGCIAYPRLLEPASSVEFADQLLAETGVMVVPGNCFLQGQAHFRLGFGRKDFPEAFEQFLAYLG